MAYVYVSDLEGRRGSGHTQGFLGVDWAFDAAAGVYAIQRIVRGDPWDPDATSPLREPGLDVRPGDHVLAVNGQRPNASTPPAELLVGQAGREVALTIRRPGGPTREIIVRAVGDELPGRYRDWAAAK